MQTKRDTMAFLVAIGIVTLASFVGCLMSVALAAALWSAFS